MSETTQAAAQELRRIGRHLEKDIELAIATWQIATGFNVEEVNIIPGDSHHDPSVSIAFNLGTIDDEADDLDFADASEEAPAEEAVN